MASFLSKVEAKIGTGKLKYKITFTAKTKGQLSDIFAESEEDAKKLALENIAKVSWSRNDKDIDKKSVKIVKVDNEAWTHYDEEGVRKIAKELKQELSHISYDRVSFSFSSDSRSKINVELGRDYKNSTANKVEDILDRYKKKYPEIEFGICASSHGQNIKTA